MATEAEAAEVEERSQPPLAIVSEKRWDVVCLMCRRNMGELARRDKGPFLFAPKALGQPRPIVSLVDVRCEVCGGTPELDEMRERLLRIEAPLEPDERPRKGRPPKWLVLQRLEQARQELSA